MCILIQMCISTAVCAYIDMSGVRELPIHLRCLRVFMYVYMYVFMCADIDSGTYLCVGLYIHIDREDVWKRRISSRIFVDICLDICLNI